MLGEVSDACAMIRDVIDPDANLIFGMSNVPKKQDVEITIIATGFVDRRYMPAKMAGTSPLIVFIVIIASQSSQKMRNVILRNLYT